MNLTIVPLCALCLKKFGDTCEVNERDDALGGFSFHVYPSAYRIAGVAPAGPGWDTG
jgi:hypothetical protein